MGDEFDRRHATIEETLTMLRRVHPQSRPSPEAIAEFHELHARHEFARGNVELEKEALARAQRARDLTRPRLLTHSTS
jgi:hypothetical protein